MKHLTKAAACAAVAALLASCSGGSSSLPASGAPGATTPSTAQVALPRVVQDAAGTRVMFYNVQAEKSGLVGGFGVSDPGGRITMRRTSGSNLTYHSGPVQTAPKMYLVLWGNWSSDVNGEASYFESFLGAIGGSKWLSAVTQYTQSSGAAVGNAAGSYVGVWNDTADAVPNLNTNSYQTAFAAEAAKAAAKFGDYSASASYIIAVPHGTPVYQFAANYSGLNGYCAWHSSTSTTGGTIAYTNFPYQSDAGSSCGANSVTGGTVNDGVSIVGGHEQAETETDPQPNSGWLDSSGSEIGDKCAWTNLQMTSFGTSTFPTQPLWSNAITGCTQAGYP